MCLYPKLIFNKKYQSNKKNGGIIPAVNDKRVLYVPVGCGKCIECCKQKAREWTIRLSEELRTKQPIYMVTLTFSEQSLRELTEYIKKYDDIKHKIYENELATLAVRRFLERWRKKYKKSVKHFLITELGHQQTERIHLHGFIFTDKPEEIEKIWNYGHIFIGQYVNQKTINYIVKYITKIDKDHKGYKPKILCSKGIGSTYTQRTDIKLNKYNANNTIETYQTRQGIKLPLPIYYRNKIYTEQEREQLWLNKLDKQERYILGEKIDISKNEEEYYKTLKYYQLKNERLGYGNDTEEWSVKMYKKERKNLKKRNKKLN